MEVVMVPEGPGQPRRVLARPAKARARARVLRAEDAGFLVLSW